MQTYSYVVHLRIWHPSIDPAVISERLQIEPKHQGHAGKPRLTRLGKKLDGTWRETHWTADPFNYGERLSHDMGIEDVLEEVAEAMVPHKEFFHLLRQEGGRLQVEVSSYSHRNYAFELSPTLLRKFGDLGLSFVHDVYPVPQAW